MHHRMSYWLQGTIRGIARSTEMIARARRNTGSLWGVLGDRFPQQRPSLYRLTVPQLSFSHRYIFVRSLDQWPPGSCTQGVCGSALVNGSLHARLGPGLDDCLDVSLGSPFEL